MINIITAADTLYYERLQGLIGSIYKCHTQQLQYNNSFCITVYDLGLNEIEKKVLNSIPGVQVKRADPVNPHMYSETPSHLVDNPRNVIGWYTWKPVIIADALKHFENIIYLDAGITVTNNLRPLWDDILTTGYFFVGVSDINYMTTKYVREKYGLTELILNKQGLASGIMGMNRYACEVVVRAAYEAARDINMFVDDGTAPGGKHAGRHDQTIFSIQVARFNLHICPSRYKIPLVTSKGLKVFNMAEFPIEINAATLVHFSRKNPKPELFYPLLKKYYVV